MNKLEFMNEIERIRLAVLQLGERIPAGYSSHYYENKYEISQYDYEILYSELCFDIGLANQSKIEFSLLEKTAIKNLETKILNCTSKEFQAIAKNDELINAGL